MSQIHISHSYQETAFSKPVKRAVIRDIRLTFEARALYIFLSDLPTNWKCHQSHIVQMSPSGTTKLRTALSALKKVGAIEISPNRLTSEEAKIKSEKYSKNYKAGQMNGWNWIIHHPDSWAIEAPLVTDPKDRFSASRKTRQPSKPKNERPDTKGLLQYGSPIKELLQENTNSDALVLPRQLSQKEKDAVALLLMAINTKRAQELLDELAGTINANLIRKSKVGFLKELVNRNKQGLFVPSLGIAVAEARERRLAEVSEKLKQKKQTSPKDHSEKLESVFSAIGHKRKKDDDI